MNSGHVGTERNIEVSCIDPKADKKQSRISPTFRDLVDHRLASGEATLAGLADAEAQGTITSAQSGRLRSEFDAMVVRREREDGEIARVGDALAEGRRLDPESDADRHAVHLHFGTVFIPKFRDRPLPEIADAVIDFVAATGIAPKQATDRLHGALIAGEADAQLLAAATLARVAEADPAALDGIPAEIADRAERLNELDRLGVPAEKAVKLADAEAAAEDGSDGEPEFEQGDEPPTEEEPHRIQPFSDRLILSALRRRLK